MRIRGCIVALLLFLAFGQGIEQLSPARAFAFTVGDQALFERSRRTALQGNWPSAVEGFNALLARDPGGPLADDAYFWLGSCYTEMERHSEAARSYRELLSRFPESPLRPDAAFRLAQLLEEKLDDDQGAEEIYRDLARDRRAEPSIRFEAQAGVARMAEKRRDYSGAIQEYQKTEKEAQSVPREPSVTVRVTKKVVRRREFLNENINRNPEALSLYTDAERLAKTGRPVEAEGYLRELISRYPDFLAMDRVLVLLAKILDKQGRCPEAYSVLEDARKQFPKSEAVAQYIKERRTLMELDQIKVRPAR